MRKGKVNLRISRTPCKYLLPSVGTALFQFLGLCSMKNSSKGPLYTYNNMPSFEAFSLSAGTFCPAPTLKLGGVGTNHSNPLPNLCTLMSSEILWFLKRLYSLEWSLRGGYTHFFESHHFCCPSFFSFKKLFLS